jgi:hypothetical protein
MIKAFKWAAVSLVTAVGVLAADSQPVELTVDLDTLLFADFLGVNAVYEAFAWIAASKAKGFVEADVQRGCRTERASAAALERRSDRPPIRSLRLQPVLKYGAIQ